MRAVDALDVALFLGTIGGGFHVLAPVSYTHLDVYKRQRRYRLRSGAASSSARVSLCTGIGACGSVFFGLLKKKSHIVDAPGSAAVAGLGVLLRNLSLIHI